MRAFISLSAALIVALAVLTACHSRDGSGRGVVAANSVAVPQGTVEGDGVRRVTPAEIHEAYTSGSAVLVDTRGEDAYKAEHIKGAISMPLAQVATRANELPRNKMIVTYCT